MKLLSLLKKKKIFQSLWPSEMAQTLSMKYVSPWATLTFYDGLHSVYKIYISLNKSILTYHFASCWILPVLRHKEPAAASKSHQSCATVQPHRRQPTRLHHSWDSPGKNTGVGCHFLLQCRKVKSESEVTQSCPTLRDPMDCSLPGSSVLGIFQARVLEWGAIAFSNKEPEFQ